MIKLLRYWNQNKRKILITIGVIALIIVIIQIANIVAKNQNEADKNQTKQNVQIAQDVTKPNQTIVSDKKITEKEVEDNSTIIKKFIDYCNQKDVESAYNILSDDCKQEVYKTIENFNNTYINQIFKTPKNYKLELWSQNGNYYTYQITYNEGNPLQTGQVNSNSNFLDYITVVKQKNEFKINTHKFIKKEVINKQGTNNNITVLVNSRNVYVDYEMYNITVANNNNQEIVLSGNKKANSICILDRINNEYTSIIHEIPTNSLKVEAGYKKTINVKFNKNYMSDSKINQMQLNDVTFNQSQNNEEKIVIKIKL
jgi:hypothetical protein